jgi:copper(I)-binding protein
MLPARISDSAATVGWQWTRRLLTVKLSDMIRSAGAILCAASLLLATPSAAENFSAGSLEIGSPWARATVRGARIAAVYMTIINKGVTADRLIGGSISIASRIEVNSAATESVGVGRVADGGLEIKPGEAVKLEPGFNQVMLIGLTQWLLPNQRVRATLNFEHAGKVDIDIDIEPFGRTTPPEP